MRIAIRAITIGYSLSMVSLLREKSMRPIVLKGYNKIFTQMNSNIYGIIDKSVL